MATLHALALQMEAKKFPLKNDKEWTHRSTAVSLAVRALLDGQKLPPSTKNKHDRRGEITAAEFDEIEEELS